MPSNMRISVSIETVWFVLITVLLSDITGMADARTKESQTMDVLENENVLLDCRFPPGLTQNEFLVYWLRSNHHGSDNVAIRGLELENNYAVDYRPEAGIYDLRISNASYNRDNGQFECRIKEGNTGRVLHSKSFDLTVLLAPSAPVIEPAVVNATEGRPINLTCSSEGGSPPPLIYWYREGGTQVLDALVIRGASKDEPTRSILRLEPNKYDDGSTFKCTVWNRALKQQNTKEAIATVSVNYFPRVTVGPENPLKVEVDTTAHLTCEVDAKPTATAVKWTRNGRFIDTHFKHTISRVSLQDAGPYTCSATNGLVKDANMLLVEDGNQDLIVDVLYGPAITLPERKEVNENDNVAIECQVSANPKPISIDWFKQGDDRFHQSGSTLRLNGITALHNGRYICSASNILQPSGKEAVTRTGNATIDINVKHRPGETFILPERPVAVDGRPITLSCGATPPGFPVPSFRWWKEGDGGESTLATGSEFTLDSARLSSAGIYHCQASNELGDGKIATVFLEVYQPPRLVTHLQPSILKTEGDIGFQVSCSAEGKPKPKVRWYKDGVEIQDFNSNLYQISTTEKEGMTESSVYNVHSLLRFVGPDRIGGNQLMPTDRGHFTCQFENDVATSDTTMLLRVEHTPVVVHQYNKVAFDTHESAVIRCKMQAFPAPKFDWSFKNSLIQSDPTMYSMNSTSLGDDVFEGILVIYTVSDSTYGDYICKSSNKMGSRSTIIKLQPKGPPESPLNVVPIYSSYDYITLGWDNGFNGGYVNTKFMVQYTMIMDGKPMYYDCLTRNPCNVTGLEQNSQYTIRVMASNEGGQSDYSDSVSIMTKVDASKIPVPKNVHFEKSTSKASFQAVDTGLTLLAKIELENDDGSWKQYDQLLITDNELSEMPVKQPVSNLRVRFCLESNELLCGGYTEALVVDVRPNIATSASLREPWVIGLIVVIVLLALVAVLVIIRCCCCKAKAKSLKSDDRTPNRPSIVHNSTQPPPYTSFGIENKGVDTLKDSDDNFKAGIYSGQNGGYGYTQGKLGSDDHPRSNSNSANGGSVNSQDSLWNVKNNTAIDMSTYPSMNVYSGTTFETVALGQPSQQQQQQQQHQISGFYGTDDYTHYPHPEEYLNERNRQYLAANGDPYAAISKPRQRLDTAEYAPYGEVNGLPEPFMDGHHSSGVLHVPGVGDTHPMQHLSYDETHQTAESDFSTPSANKSRRIIREIIV